MLQRQKVALAITEELMQECEVWEECEECINLELRI